MKNKKKFLFFNKKNKPIKTPAQKRKENLSLFWTIALIIFIRSFLISPFQIPSESMYPTLVVGDHLFVSMSSYDVKIPFIKKRLFKVNDPKRGDIVVFTYPNYEGGKEFAGKYFIKRLVANPGDTVEVKNGLISINGIQAIREYRETYTQKDLPSYPENSSYKFFTEKLPDRENEYWTRKNIQVIENFDYNKTTFKSQFDKECIPPGTLVKDPYFFSMVGKNMVSHICEFKVPNDMYFVMGDNRDNSSDSRMWGFVPRKLLMGKALSIWFSITPPNEGGTKLNKLERALMKSPAAPIVSVLRAPRAIFWSIINYEKYPYVRWNRTGYTVK